MAVKPSKIRVLHLINIDIGIRIHLRSQLLYLQSKGFEVTAACSPGERFPADTVTEEGIPVKTIPMTRQISPIKDLFTLLELYRYFRREKFDIVHTHSLKPELLGQIAAFLARVPVRLHTIHGFRFHDNMSPIAKKFYIFLERIGNRLSHASLSQGKEDIEVAIREKICKPERIFYLGNGIDVSQFTTPMDRSAVEAKKRMLGIAPSDKVVGIVGRQTQIKGYLEFIQAAKLIAAEIPNVKFIMIGPSEEGNPEALDIPDLVQQNNLQEVMLPLGARQDMRELYGIMDIMTLPSWLEGIPRVLIEASMCGKPIVASDIPGNREVIEPGFNGFLVPVGDAQTLATTIKELLLDEAKAVELGLNGKQRALELFDEKIYLERLLQMYEHILHTKLPYTYSESAGQYVA